MEDKKKKNTSVSKKEEVSEKTEDINIIIDNNAVSPDGMSSDFEEKESKAGKVVVIVLLVIIALGLIAGGVYLALNKDEEKPDIVDVEPVEYKSSYKMNGNSIQDFDLYFLQLNNEVKNKVYSPLSIKYALAMLNEGAKGDSNKQIKAVIGDYKTKKYNVNEHMSFANAVFLKNSFKESVNESFVTGLGDKFGAEVIYDSFEKPDAVNNWVSEKTFNLVKNMTDDISQNDFILVNALAINMEWNKRIQASPENFMDEYSVAFAHEKYSHYIPIYDALNPGEIDFNDKKVKALEFGASINNYDIIKVLGEDNIKKNISDGYTAWLKSDESCGDDLPVDEFVANYMKELGANYKQTISSTDFKLYDDENIKVFSKELKTYEDTTLEYVAIMPKKETLESYVKGLDAKKVSAAIDSLKDIKSENFKDGVITKVTGFVPVFNFDYELDLIPSLKKLGITNIFDVSTADLTGISSENSLFVDTVMHKANIEFSNDGIKAGAATMVGGRGSVACGYEYLYDVPVETIDMTFDKPYVFLIRDKSSGEVWFIGTVYEPTLK